MCHASLFITDVSASPSNFADAEFMARLLSSQIYINNTVHTGDKLHFFSRANYFHKRLYIRDLATSTPQNIISRSTDTDSMSRTPNPE
jgi:hypothetical protein